MPRTNNKSRSSNNKQQRTVTGPSAISRIVKFSKDQALERIGRRYSGPNSLSKIADDIKHLKSLINTEEKHIDTSVSAFTVSQTVPVVQQLTTTAQGSASTQRTGNSQKVNRIDLSMSFLYDSGTVATSARQNQIFSWFLVRYLKTVTAAAFSVTDFLQNDVTGNVTPLSMANTDLNEDFQVMASGIVNVDLHEATTAISNVIRMAQVSHPCSFHQTFTGSAASTIVDNNVFVVITAINPINGGGTSTASVFARMFYVDN
jgi:hypothetical protein